MKYDYLIGKTLLVKDSPFAWSSALNRNSPLGLKYPRNIILKEIKLNSVDFEAYDATCGEFGWDIETLLEVSEIVLEKTSNSEIIEILEKFLVSNNEDGLSLISNESIQNSSSI